MLPTGARMRHSGDWGAVYGELLTFDDPDSRLPAIDRFEGFRPGASSHYLRVLVHPPHISPEERPLAYGTLRHESCPTLSAETPSSFPHDSRVSSRFPRTMSVYMLYF